MRCLLPSTPDATSVPVAWTGGPTDKLLKICYFWPTSVLHHARHPSVREDSLVHAQSAPWAHVKGCSASSSPQELGEGRTETALEKPDAAPSWRCALSGDDHSRVPELL